MADDPEWRVRLLLAHQGELIDPDRSTAMEPKELGLQQSVNRGAPIRLDPAGQGHVKAEFLEHIGIAPALEVRGLPRAEPGQC